MLLPRDRTAEDLEGKGTVILWFRNDLRLHDNATLTMANTGSALLPVYVFDPRLFGSESGKSQLWGFSKTGPVRTRFLIEAVENLRKNLTSLQSELIVRVGKPEDVIPEIARSLQSENSPVTVMASKEAAFEERRVENRLRKNLLGIEGPSGPPELKLAWEGTMHHLRDLPFNPQIGTPPVFTQYRKIIEVSSSVRPELPSVTQLKPLPPVEVDTGRMPTLDSLTDEVYPQEDERSVLKFKGGEDAALERIDTWIWKQDLLRKYKETRNGSGTAEFSSKLSPWLALGCISPRRVHANVKKYEEERVADENTYWLIFELITRDFFRWMMVKEDTRLFSWKGYSQRANQGQRQRGGSSAGTSWGAARDLDFAKVPASDEDMQNLAKWIKGQTGVPFVDAGMRELRATGFMSNRLRQNVASFLIHDLAFPDWRAGAEYFESALIDHEVAANYGNWAYIAGVGSDPRGGRRFNMVLQAQTYDGDAAFTKLWCPELKQIPAGNCHQIFKMDDSELEEYGVRLGINYPRPIAKVKDFKYGKTDASPGGGKQFDSRNNRGPHGKNRDKGRKRR